jgi:hypothetical protein
MAMRVLQISTELLLSLFKEGPARTYGVTKDPLPSDVRWVGVAEGWVGDPERLAIFVESESFPALGDDAPLESWDLPPVECTLVSRPELEVPHA